MVKLTTLEPTKVRSFPAKSSRWKESKVAVFLRGHSVRGGVVLSYSAR